VSQSQVGAPADTIMLWEFWCTESYGRWYSYFRADTRQLAQPSSPASTFPPSWPQTYAFNWCGSGDGRMTMGTHSGKTNFGFADGHVKTMSRQGLMVTPWTNAAITSRANAGQSNRNLFHFNGTYK
jgi:prepilin-type processing-associated H-X9-DG protein